LLSYPACNGRHVFCGMRQSIPSSSMVICEVVSQPVVYEAAREAFGLAQRAAGLAATAFLRSLRLLNDRQQRRRTR